MYGIVWSGRPYTVFYCQGEHLASLPLMSSSPYATPTEVPCSCLVFNCQLSWACLSSQNFLIIRPFQVCERVELYPCPSQTQGTQHSYHSTLDPWKCTPLDLLSAKRHFCWSCPTMLRRKSVRLTQTGSTDSVFQIFSLYPLSELLNQSISLTWALKRI